MTAALVEPADWHGRAAWRLRHAGGAQAVVGAQGGQTLSWTTADGRERLYHPPTPPADAQAPVRGGMPVVFPQFGAAGPLPRHGFARQRRWQACGAAVEAGVPTLRLVLRDDAATRALWPHAFRATLVLRLEAAAFEARLSVLNTGEADLGFTAALHTYLRVDPAEAPRAGPFEGRLWRVDGAVDRVFAGTGPRLQFEDAAGPLAIEHGGFPDAVLWNPGPDGAAALGDLPPADWRAMLCIEAAHALRPVHLAPGLAWCGRQRLVA